MDILLTVENINKFFGGVAAITDLSFDLRQGELLGLIGPNGAGKTTLFNMISGFLEPDKGRINFQGQSIIGLPPHKIVMRGITRTFQIPKPFHSLSCLENIIVSMIPHLPADKEEARRIKEKSQTIMKITGLHPKGDMLPSVLTQGDLKKLEIARALATKPKLLLLDEPFAGLTSTDIAHLSSVIKNLHGSGITLIIVEHRLKELMKIAQKLIVLDFGQKIADGPPEVIIHNEKVIEAYLGTGGVESCLF